MNAGTIIFLSMLALGLHDKRDDLVGYAIGMMIIFSVIGFVIYKVECRLNRWRDG